MSYSFKAPKILSLDLETAPMVVYAWGLFDQNIGLEQIIEDWSILSFSAKFVGEKTVYYKDTSKKKNIRDDKDVVKALVELIDQSDVILTQNGKRFDVKKLKSRMQVHGMAPLNEKFIHVDVLTLNRKHFAHTSNKLEYITKKFCRKYKKSGHKKFPGFVLWKECLNRNPQAWKEMEDYNKIDVLSMEEYYLEHLAPWDNSINLDVFHEGITKTCFCGSISFRKAGHFVTKTGKFRRFRCNKCGKTHNEPQNLFSKEKRASIKR